MQKNLFSYYITLVIIILSQFVLVTSCKNEAFVLNEEQIVFKIPDWPPDSDYGDKSLYPPLSKWIIKITSPDFYEKKVITNEKEITVESKKNVPLSITATPITITADENETSFFYCAGTIYPYHYEEINKNKGNGYLTWEEGFSAFILQQLILSVQKEYSSEEISKYISEYNWYKMQQEIDKKIKESEFLFTDEKEKTNLFYNPWQIDIPVLLESIAYRTFKISNLNTKSFCVYDYINIEGLLSAYVPENRIIQKYNCISLKKNAYNFFSIGNTYEIILQGSSVKNLSTEYVFLPIFIDEYEKE